MTRPTQAWRLLFLGAVALLGTSAGQAHPDHGSDGYGPADVLAAPQPKAPVDYSLDANSSRILALVRKDPTTLGQGLSHDHVVRATGWSGAVRYSPDDPASCSISLTLPVGSFVVDEPEMRALVGFDSKISKTNRGTVRQNMLAKGQLWANQHARVSFEATSCEPRGDKLLVRGELSIRGVRKSIVVPMSTETTGGKLTARGSFRIRHADFGFKPYVALLGALKNLDEIEVRLSFSGRAG